MRRALPITLAISAALGLGLTGTADAAPASRYTVTRTVGPYNGQATWQNGLPGQVPDGEAPSVYCRPGDAAVHGRAHISRLHSRLVLRIDGHGTFFNSENDLNGFYAWVAPTGRHGWNSVTLWVTCRRGRA